MNIPSTVNKTMSTSCSSTASRSSLQIHDRRDSTGRIISPIAFFRDGVTTSEIDLRYNFMGAQRRARAIATAPRRNRYNDDDDDDDDDQTEKRSGDKRNVIFGFVPTSSIPIPSNPLDIQQTQSLPQTQSGLDLIPSFRIDPPERNVNEDLNCLYSNEFIHHRYSSPTLPSLNNYACST